MSFAIRGDHVSKRFRLVMGSDGYRVPTFKEEISEKWGALWMRLLKRQRMGAVPEFWALRDASFEIKHGEVVGFIGDNGAGKTTLLKLIARILRPTEGRVEVRGRVGSLLEVGAGFHSEFTGRENVYLSGAILGMKRAEISRKFEEIIGFADIGPFLDIPVKRYSKGMYLRLAFAVASHLEPEILLIDEVFAVGDVGFQKKCLERTRYLAQEGRTILLVSHSLPAIQALCERAYLLEHGKIITSGPANVVVKTYLRRKGDFKPADFLQGDLASANMAA